MEESSIMARRLSAKIALSEVFEMDNMAWLIKSAVPAGAYMAPGHKKRYENRIALKIVGGGGND